MQLYLTLTVTVVYHCRVNRHRPTGLDSQKGYVLYHLLAAQHHGDDKDDPLCLDSWHLLRLVFTITFFVP
jgi:hypothetical protein